MRNGGHAHVSPFRETPQNCNGFRLCVDYFFLTSFERPGSFWILRRLARTRFFSRSCGEFTFEFFSRWKGRVGIRGFEKCIRVRKLEHVLPELVNMYSGGGKFRIHLLHLKTRRLMKREVWTEFVCEIIRFFF